MTKNMLLTKKKTINQRSIIKTNWSQYNKEADLPKMKVIIIRIGMPTYKLISVLKVITHNKLRAIRMRCITLKADMSPVVKKKKKLKAVRNIIIQTYKCSKAKVNCMTAEHTAIMWLMELVKRLFISECRERFIES